jgi:uncharacterized membrane protein YgaE (UPF0421/DUF939 family)
MTLHTPRTVARGARRRVLPHFGAVVQTAIAALAAWWVALAVLPTEQPAFASIAAVISLGVAHGKRRRRAVELVGGVVTGITVASVLVWLIGTGVLQIGLLVALAMGVALLFRAGELVVSEAAVSAILLANFQTSHAAFSADRVLEAVIGGVVALVVAALVLPPDPVRLVGEGAQEVLGRLAATLQELAAALSDADAERAGAALRSARSLDDQVEALEEALVTGIETASLAPARRRDAERLRRYEHALPQIDFAVRNTRVLARHASRHTRGRGPVPVELPEAVEALAAAVRALAAHAEAPIDATISRDIAVGAAAKASSVSGEQPALAEQVRLVAVDLVRASERLSAGDPVALVEHPTEELLAVA